MRRVWTLHVGYLLLQAKQHFSPCSNNLSSVNPVQLLSRPGQVQVLERVKRKAATYGQDFAGLGNGAVAAADDAAGQKILPETVSRLYEMWVMPLTKDVEVQYLMRRLEVE